MTSPYHQGPPFPVSSSPILPLDVQPTRTKRPSPLSLLPLSDYPHHFSNPSVVLSNGSHPHGLAPDSARPAPPEWTDNTAACINASGLDSQYTESTTCSTEIVSNAPCPIASTPAGWDSDLPINLLPYAPLAQGSEAGTTFFYRSPTPSARQRTNQACEKCRDRKTKCSGGRPSCVRCQTRGLVCEYAIEHRVRGPAKARKRNIPALDPPTSASPTRTSFFHHPYTPPMQLSNSRWDLQPISLKAQQTNMALKSGWSLSDHSDASSDSSGAASFELSERTPSHLGFPNRQGVEFTSQQPRDDLNSLDHPNNRFPTMHRSVVNTKDQFIAPTLRPYPSMPQLKSLPFHSLPFQNSGVHGTPGTYTSNSYPKHTILNKQLPELPHGSLQSRCPSSSSSSCASRSNASADDARNTLANAMSSNTTLTPENWPAPTNDVRGKRYSWKGEHSLPEVGSTPVTEGEIPKSSSQTFNVSDWITGTDYCSSPERTAESMDTVTPES